MQARIQVPISICDDFEDCSPESHFVLSVFSQEEFVCLVCSGVCESGG